MTKIPKKVESVDKEKWKDYHNSMMSDRTDIIESFAEWYTLRYIFPQTFNK